MKGNKKILLLAALLLLVSVSFTTYAIYRSAAGGTAEVTAAVWDVTFEDEDENTLTDNYTVTFDATECTTAHVEPGKIAPGATCTKTIILNAGDSEVDV